MQWHLIPVRYNTNGKKNKKYNPNEEWLKSRFGCWIYASGNNSKYVFLAACKIWGLFYILTSLLLIKVYQFLNVCPVLTKIGKGVC